MTSEEKGGRMKSAIEIAMERTADVKPAEDPYKLTDEQKAKIREINREFDAKIAEVETRMMGELRKLAEAYPPEELSYWEQGLYERLRQEKERINEDRRSKTDPIHQSARKKDA